MSKISVYSQNVSSDKHSEMLINSKHLTFESRITKILDDISKMLKKGEDIDIIGFNEIRYKDRVDLVTSRLEKLKYEVKVFRNNDHNEMAFRNIVAINKSSKWKIENWKHQWVAHDENKSYMSEKFATIEGDPHGRCAGIVYLRHKDFSARKVCVVVSHVVPFGEVKKRQQNALFSINQTNLKSDIPTIFVGDFNRFSNEDKEFQQQLDFYGVIESVPTKLVIPGPNDKVFTDPDDIGTFTPWPNDEVYEEKISKPMKDSRLDVHAYSKNPKDLKLISVDETFVRASMFKDGIEEKNNPKISEHRNFNRVRFLLDRKMASDHIPIISTFRVYGN